MGIVSECREAMLQSRMMKVVEGWGQSKIVPREIVTFVVGEGLGSFSLTFPHLLAVGQSS